MSERIEAAGAASFPEMGDISPGVVRSTTLAMLRAAFPELFDGNHKIVPLEATEDMWLASIKITPLKEPAKAAAKRSYRDMVAAAP